MKKSILLAIFLISQIIVFGQDELIVRQHEKGLYLLHTVAPKENFYSIGRLYNVSAKEIASFNTLDMEKGLNIGQVLMVPLNNNNFTQKNNNGRAVYYVVGPKEGLYRVSVKNNNVLMADLRKWNQLDDDNIAEGQKLVVGYLVSPEAGNIVVANDPPKPANNEPKNDIAFQEPVNVQKDEVKKQVVEEPKKTEPLPVKQEVKQELVNNNGSYFKNDFDRQVRTQPIKKDETASAGIFKTASGWQDGKYYALIDGVEPGTIIRLINPTNSKAVYAKVLGPMSGIRQNQGYDVRISNAAASALEVTDTDKFIVKVNY